MRRSLAPSEIRRGRIDEGVVLNTCINLQYKTPLLEASNLPLSLFERRALGIKRSFVRRSLHDSNAENALILYKAAEVSPEMLLTCQSNDDFEVDVVVDPMLTQFLRPHQREGVKFMFDSLMGYKVPSAYGCIMADDMGLGKTLQCITLLWTLLRQSPKCTPAISKALIVTPSSLVKNWHKEITKWLGERLRVLSIDSGNSEQANRDIEHFLLPKTCYPILIISYEMFRMHALRLHRSEIGAVICDEGHRLKNCANQTYEALFNVKSSKRILISGTPIQNDLLEYFSLLNFVNPGYLGTPVQFKKMYSNPILRGRDKDASDSEKSRSRERLQQLISAASKCMIRRTAKLLTHYLPIKYEYIVCINLSSIQKKIYMEYLQKVANEINSQQFKLSALISINVLKKICSHPDLINEETSTPPPTNRSRAFDPSLSSKFVFLETLLRNIKHSSNDKVVLISNYTQTLDLFEKLCTLHSYSFVRLDGSCSIKKRGKLVQRFNENAPNSEFIFMLSSKAGGCGLNLIGANRLVMFDPDWNPANDQQAMARVWRDGQKKECFIYRLFATGSIEEKILQRQSHKRSLSDCVIDANSEENTQEQAISIFSDEELKEIFSFNQQTFSDSHDKINCKRSIILLASLANMAERLTLRERLLFSARYEVSR